VDSLVGHPVVVSPAVLDVLVLGHDDQPQVGVQHAEGEGDEEHDAAVAGREVGQEVAGQHDADEAAEGDADGVDDQPGEDEGGPTLGHPNQEEEVEKEEDGGQNQVDLGGHSNFSVYAFEGRQQSFVFLLIDGPILEFSIKDGFDELFGKVSIGAGGDFDPRVSHGYDAVENGEDGHDVSTGANAEDATTTRQSVHRLLR